MEVNANPGKAGGLVVLLMFGRLLFGQAVPHEENLTRHPAHDRHGSYSPDGNRIVFESNRNGNWDIFLLERTDGSIRPITTDTSDERSPSWHPSGEKILFEKTTDGQTQIWLLDLNNGQRAPLDFPGLPEGKRLFGRFSPNGRRLAFSVQTGQQVFHLFVADLTTHTWQQLTRDTFRHTYPAWSPDGNCLTFHARHETGNDSDEIYTMKPGSGKMRRLTRRAGHDFCPAWSPDGKHLAYCVSSPGSAAEIFIMKKNGRKKRQITNHPDNDILPAWSPDGKKLLVTAFRDGNYELCEIPVR